MGKYIILDTTANHRNCCIDASGDERNMDNIYDADFFATAESAQNWLDSWSLENCEPTSWAQIIDAEEHGLIPDYSDFEDEEGIENAGEIEQCDQPTQMMPSTESTHTTNTSQMSMLTMSVRVVTAYRVDGIHDDEFSSDVIYMGCNKETAEHVRDTATRTYKKGARMTTFSFALLPTESMPDGHLEWMDRWSEGEIIA